MLSLKNDFANLCKFLPICAQWREVLHLLFNGNTTPWQQWEQRDGELLGAKNKRCN